MAASFDPGQQIPAPNMSMPPPEENVSMPPPPGAPVSSAPAPPLVQQPQPMAPPEPVRPSDIGIAGMRRVDKKARADTEAATGQMQTGYDAEQAALQKKAELEAADAKVTAPYRAHEADLAQVYETQMIAAQERAKQQTAQQVATLQEMERNAAASGSQKGFWANQSVGSKIGWAIALGVGAFAQASAAARGQNIQNGAMQIFDRALQEDAQDKARQMQAGRDKVAGQRGVMGEMRQAFGDEQQAVKANYIVGLGKIDAQINALMANTADQRVLAQAQVLKSELQTKRNEAYAGFVQGADAHEMERAHAISGALQTKEQMDYTRMIAEYNAQAKAQAAQKGQTWRQTVPGFLPSQTEEQGKELTNRFVQYMTAHDQISPLADIIAPMGADGKRHPVGMAKLVSNPDTLARMNQLSSLLTLTNLENFHRGAAVSDQEMKLVNAVRGVGSGGEVAWTAFAPETVAGLLDKLDKYGKSQVYNYALASGQATPEMIKQDVMDPAKLGAMDWGQYVANTPRQQKEIRGQ